MASITTPDSDLYTIFVVEDHPTTLAGIHSILQRFGSKIVVETLKTLQEAREAIQQLPPNLLVLDLQLPENSREPASTETGIQFLKDLMQTYPHLNIAIHSSYPDALIRILPDIDNHRGGFTVTNKDSSTEKAFERFNAALQGYTHTRDIRSLKAGLELKPEWLSTLDLACTEGYQDRAIAKHLHVSESMVRNYWSKIYDVLGIYPEDEKEEGRNLRIVTCLKAREEGLVD
ncbi:MAG: response regulator transcription factor [Leptolyngbya sp. SIO1E4]|nr:response regulator transcription factor [Leptolyngbya sp. SIO1E4]